jgi:hypothetical protein
MGSKNTNLLKNNLLVISALAVVAVVALIFIIRI